MRRRLAIVIAVVVAPVLVGVIGVPAAQAAASIQVTVTPATAKVGATLTVDITVSGTTNPQLVDITRRDRTGSHPLPSGMTDDAGHYSFTDPASVRGRITYIATLSTDSTVSGSGHADIAGLTTKLTIAAAKTLVLSGNDVRVTAHLGTTATNRTVSIYAKPYHRDRRLLVRHDVDANGDLVVAPTVHRRTTYIAHFGGDDTYAPASASVVVMAHALVIERLHGGYATVNGVRLFHATGVPVLSAHLLPQLEDRCIWFKAQRRYGGAWHTVALRCFRTDQYGHAQARFENVQLNSRYRVRARFRGGPAATADSGPWFRLEAQ